MVYFTCNYCGESLKKSAVDRHYSTVCRRPKNLTCLDCMRDFNQVTFNSHTRCITEDEKYSAKNSSGQTSSTEQSFQKGEVKQQTWLGVIKYAYEHLSQQSPNHRELLRHLLRHNNVPQKQQKFMNYVKNMAFRVHQATAEAVWQLLWNTYKVQQRNKLEQMKNKMGAPKQEASEKDKGVEKGKELNHEGGDNVVTVLQTDPISDDSDSAVSVTNVGKDTKETNGVSNKKRKKPDLGSPKGVLNKKRKKSDYHVVSGFIVTSAEEESSEISNAGENSTQDQDKIRAGFEVCDLPSTEVTMPESNGDDCCAKKKKFKWMKAMCLELLDADDHSLSIKHLKKGVLGRYRQFGGKVGKVAKAKFDKKLLKHPNVMVNNGKAKLAQELNCDQ